MPEYKVNVVLTTNIEAVSPEMARRIALEGAVALIQQKDSAEAEFNSVMPQQSFPRFIYEKEEIDGEDTPTEDGLDNSEETV